MSVSKDKEEFLFCFVEIMFYMLEEFFFGFLLIYCFCMRDEMRCGEVMIVK